LTLAHFDFRILAAINMMLAVLASLLFIGAARVYRGFDSLGDLFIPLCLLSLGTGFSQWGQELHFLSTILFSAAFAFFMAVRWLPAAFSVLFLCTWCGLNGLIISSFVVLATIAIVALRYAKLDRLALSILVVTILVNAILWATWTPSAASEASSAGQVFTFTLHMINAPLIVYAFVNPSWKLAVMIGLNVAGTLAAIYVAIRQRTFPSLLMLALIGSGWLVIVSTAFGRAATNPWVPGLEMHYGSLAMPLLIAAWIAISGALPRQLSTLIGLAFVALFACAYWANYQWKAISTAERHDGDLAARLAIASSEDPQIVAAQHIGRYFYIDTPQTRKMVAAEIPLLRQVSHYGPRQAGMASDNLPH
jgi:hypothetical protein